MKLLFAGGGTGGHLYSGVAVAREAQRLAPGTEIVFVGTERGIETKVLPREGYRLVTLPIAGIKGKGLFGAIAGLLRVPVGLAKSFALLKREKPGAVIGIGGYASGPTVMAAWAAGYPTAIIEQNVIPGLTNRTLGRVVRRVYAPLEDAVARFPRPGVVKVTGNPIRRAVVDEALAAKAVAKAPGLNLLVFGGSQGARRINQAMVEALPSLKRLGVSIVHQTGEADFETVKKGYADAGVTADVRPFLHDMGAQYAKADLVICRAGASTISELLGCGKPAILVPYPHAIYDHQAKNAEALAARGAARWVKDAELSGERLAAEIAGMDSGARETLAKNALALGRPDAATVIAREILEMARAGSGGSGRLGSDMATRTDHGHTDQGPRTRDSETHTDSVNVSESVVRRPSSLRPSSVRVAVSESLSLSEEARR